MRGAIPPFLKCLNGVVLNYAQDVFMVWPLDKHRDKFTLLYLYNSYLSVGGRITLS
jgi:hypothetical protein